ncbi:MAG: thioredoxin domain-containing protein, partial [Deltaproteobacteria bacterium]|nr:thioredoxin domain-containing protein [Deltaproteobacteria bacterium]
ADVAEGKRLGVEGVPTFFINGRKVTGARTKEEFKAIIDEELARVRDAEDLYRAGYHLFIRGNYEEAFTDWALAVERSPNHEDSLQGLMRLENIAERLLREVERDADTTSACRRLEEVTRLTRAKSPLHERAQGGLRARCR